MYSLKIFFRCTVNCSWNSCVGKMNNSFANYAPKELIKPFKIQPKSVIHAIVAPVMTFRWKISCFHGYWLKILQTCSFEILFGLLCRMDINSVNLHIFSVNLCIWKLSTCFPCLPNSYWLFSHTYHGITVTVNHNI